MNESSTPAGQTIRIARVVPAPPAAIFKALTDPTLMRAWWGKTEKSEIVDCRLDVRVGGHYRIEMRTAAGASEVATGEYLEVNPPVGLAFTWTVPSGGAAVAESRVAMSLMDLKDGTTRVMVIQEGLTSPSAVTAQSAGWHDAIQDLNVHFAKA